jgi:nitrite reductase (cytochrome c-552)
MIETSCRQCHTDKTSDYLRERVEYTQKKTYNQLMKAQDASVRAHEAVRRASEWMDMRSPDYDSLMAQAREMVREGQFYWDYVSAENSVGFHNPVKAMETLALSIDRSDKAVAFASAATNYGIAPALMTDIKELVPPIVDWSRQMQMDQANLDKHVWTKYVKLLPKQERLWEQQKRIR